MLPCRSQVSSRALLNMSCCSRVVLRILADPRPDIGAAATLLVLLPLAAPPVSEQGKTLPGITAEYSCSALHS